MPVVVAGHIMGEQVVRTESDNPVGQPPLSEGKHQNSLMTILAENTKKRDWKLGPQ